MVISIIGILTSISLIGLKAARGKAKDMQIKSDLRGIATALESYALDKAGAYPVSNLDATDEDLNGGDTYTALVPRARAAFTCPSDTSDTACALLKGYLPKIPKSKADGSPYVYFSDGTGYTLSGIAASNAAKSILVRHISGKHRLRL